MQVYVQYVDTFFIKSWETIQLHLANLLHKCTVYILQQLRYQDFLNSILYITLSECCLYASKVRCTHIDILRG